MQTFAVINDNIVVNIIVAETLEDAEEVTGLTCSPLAASIGDIYDPETDTFTTPEPPEWTDEPDPALLVPGPKPHELPPATGPEEDTPEEPIVEEDPAV